MTNDEATGLAVKVREVWGGSGPAVNVWVEELEPLAYPFAREALNRLKRELDRAPSIARFFAAYNEVRREHEPTGAVTECEMCDGAGWVETDGYEAHGETYSAVRPCRCTAGQRAEQLHVRLVGAERRESAA